MTLEQNTVAWMAHPLAGDIPGNIAKAKRWMRWLIRAFHIDFAADWILWCEILDDNDPAERARGIKFCQTMVSKVDAYWMVGGRISNGMATELEAAKEHKKFILDLTFMGSEPPDSTDIKQLPNQMQMLIWKAFVKGYNEHYAQTYRPL